jgi:hypothetical protein
MVAAKEVAEIGEKLEKFYTSAEAWAKMPMKDVAGVSVQLLGAGGQKGRALAISVQPPKHPKKHALTITSLAALEELQAILAMPRIKEIMGVIEAKKLGSVRDDAPTV